MHSQTPASCVTACVFTVVITLAVTASCFVAPSSGADEGAEAKAAAVQAEATFYSTQANVHIGGPCGAIPSSESVCASRNRADELATKGEYVSLT